MKMCIIEDATSLADGWFRAIVARISEGRKYLITKGSYEGIHRIGMPTMINFTHPGARPLFPMMPEGSNIPAPTSEQDINDYLEYLMTGEKKENEHYTYGEDLHWQINWCIKHFKEAGHGNNHCYMTVGRPETLYYYDLSVEYEEKVRLQERFSGETQKEYGFGNAWNNTMGNKPSSQCLRGIDTWIDEGKLHFWTYFRSWDLWGGFPVNLGGIQLLKEYMASEIGVEDGELVVSCKDLHVYEHAWLVALMRLRKNETILERR
ncbi:MAG: thymidylate synthase [Patescibacteria group bacterium]|nr:thymidylate synthase [Patescibacteria group bacterium]